MFAARKSYPFSFIIARQIYPSPFTIARADSACFPDLYDLSKMTSADAAALAILDVLKPIVTNTENMEARKINSVSRVSKIPLILEAKWGGEILNTIGFYPSKGHWFLPANAPMDLVMHGDMQPGPHCLKHRATPAPIA